MGTIDHTANTVIAWRPEWIAELDSDQANFVSWFVTQCVGKDTQCLLQIRSDVMSRSGKKCKGKKRKWCFDFSA